MFKLRMIGLMVLVIFVNMSVPAPALVESSVPATEPTLIQKHAISVLGAGKEHNTSIDSPVTAASDPLLAEEQTLSAQGAETSFSTGFSFSEETITLSALQTTTSWDDRDASPSRFELPLLVLHRGRAAAPAPDRTLDVQIADLPAGAEISIELTSRHVDVSTGDYHRVAKQIVLPARACTADDPCKVRWILDPTGMRSDFYDLRIKDAGGKLLWEKAYPDRPDLVALDTWDVPLGAYTVRLTYANLFPFARGKNDLANRLTPDAVTDFIAGQFVPIIQDTWQTQFNAWGFGRPVHSLWDADNLVEIFITTPPYALFEGTGTYHRSTHNGGQPYPQRRLWWYASNDAFQAYAYRAVFAHEFFHLMQWNVTLLAQKPLIAGQASAGCSTNRWMNVFIEGQGKFAPSVQYPETEIGHHNIANIENVGSEYMSAANHFLTQRLNSSYRDMETDPTDKYDAALYWRFLYEQYGDMAIVRAALEEMACGYDVDIVAGMPRVMDRAFQRVDGPFQNFEESLTAFARANYALRLENGRCADDDFSACEGFYLDPETVYVDPSLEAALIYDGAPLTYAGTVPTSFGMDFIEINVDPAVQGQPLTIKVQGAGEIAQFSVQVWHLGSDGRKSRALAPQPATIPPGSDGAYIYPVTQLDTTETQKLALIIVRLDADETADPVGRYGIVIRET